MGQVMIRGNCPLRSLWPFTIASMILGWSDPRFTKQWLTPALHSASKKADDAVYIVAVSYPPFYISTRSNLFWVWVGNEEDCVVPGDCARERGRGSRGLRGSR